MNINYSEIELSKCLKFLGVLLDENLCWQEPIKYNESKIAVGLLYKAKPYIPFCHCIIVTYILILTTETLHGEVQPR